jgi:hypothetical protein
MMFSYEPNKLQVDVTGGFGAGVTAGPNHTAVFSINDDLSLLRGNHQLAFGVHTAAWWANSYSDNYAGVMTFGGQVTGLGLADYLMGNVDLFSMGSTAGTNKRAKYIGRYGNDTWKVNQKLTFNYGLRWEPFFPLINVDGRSCPFRCGCGEKGS